MNNKQLDQLRKKKRLKIRNERGDITMGASDEKGHKGLL
jgi:hypothetical protein